MHDVVVIGAGSAGAVIAARASEDPNRTVLLLEAGPDYPVLADTPWDLVNSHDNSYDDHDWRFQYLPSTADRLTRFPRGRVTGGSSAVNTAIALRGMPEDYDDWAAAGNPAWSWERVLPAFRRLERDLDFGAEPYHGDAGPITVRRYPHHELTEAHQAFLEASRALGYPDCPDANEPWGWGAGPQPMNKLGRLRVSTAVGYLAAARIRPNLTIQPDSPARRLLVEGGRVVGVEIEHGGEVRQVRGRLVVLSAGAIQSPTILQRSGVGLRAHLEALGIDVVADVPGVGQNLGDHPAVSVVCAVKDPLLADPDQPIIQTILRYTAPGSDLRNDLQIEQITFVRTPDGTPAFAVSAVLEAPFGRGCIRLKSADPHEGPHIEPNFGVDERDNERLAGCFEEALRFVRTPPLADLVAGVRFPRLPLDHEGALSIVRRRSHSGYHPCGTVKMGPTTDPGAVVDDHARCHALDGLVVADASIMPTVPRANTNLTSIMIGEMVGEWLRTRPGLYGL